MAIIDWIVFLGFIAAVVGIGIWKGRDEGTGTAGSESYFLAGRGLSWWLIGFSLIAANISSEQFVGMSGQAADYVGLAIASYEWLAAVSLLIVGFVFLPRFLRTGVYTVPEFLEYRYNEASRSIMALFTMIIYVGVTISAVIYSGALTFYTLYSEIDIVAASWIIGIIAAVYVAAGGLKACAWADLLQGSALILCGGIITYLAFKALGAAPLDGLFHNAADTGSLTDASSGVEKFFYLNADKLHMKLPASDLILPWTALLVGLWIPNLYYWGFNQYIIQRTLGSHSLKEGQRGIVFAAVLKILIPFVIVFPEIIAFNLFGDQMMDLAKNDAAIKQKWAHWEADCNQPPGKNDTYFLYQPPAGFDKKDPEKAAKMAQYNEAVRMAAEAAGKQAETIVLPLYKYDSAFGLLVQNLVPANKGLRGFILAALLGAIVSSLASMLNAASTIFTMDLYKKYLHRNAKDRTLVLVGRVCVGVFVVIGCLISPLLGDPKFGGIFTFIQEFQGFISPGILAVFIFGFLVKRAPAVCGVVGLLINPLMYMLLKWLVPSLSFLDRMAVSFFCVLGVLYLITLLKPLPQPVALPNRATIAMEPSRSAQIGAVLVLACIAALYVYFW